MSPDDEGGDEPSTVKTALVLGAVGGLCGGCISLLSIGVGGLVAAAGVLWLGVGVALAGIAVAVVGVLWLRRRRGGLVRARRP